MFLHGMHPALVRSFLAILKHLITFQNGFTPLHIAAKYNSTNAATLLINSGANIDALSKVSNCKFRGQVFY